MSSTGRHTVVRPRAGAASGGGGRHAAADTGPRIPAPRTRRPRVDAVLRAIELVRLHGRVRALDGVSLVVERGSFTAVMGASGSGKSTLLHCLAGLDRPTSGHVLLDRTDLTGLSERQLTRLRRMRIGVVFQSYDLLPQLTVRQNVVLPVEIAGRRVDRAWLGTVLAALDLSAVQGHLPGELSGGQQQRVAVARALVARPDVVLADEPTGALDAGTTAALLRFLRTCVDELGRTVVMVTHDPLAVEYADRAVLLHEGRTVAELREPTAHEALDALADVHHGSRRRRA